MGKNIKTLKQPDEKVIKAAKFVNFKIKKEGWNLYEIEDGTLLRARVLLTGVLIEDKLEEIVKQLEQKQKPKFGLNFRSRHIFVVESPPELRGKPNPKTYTPAELNSHIINEDMDFETLKEVWNTYELENGITLKTRLSAVTVNKTSKFESAGMPIYTVNLNIDFKVDFPENLQKLLEKKGKGEQA